jgi:hypothetical protein
MRDEAQAGDRPEECVCGYTPERVVAERAAVINGLPSPKM